jgi:Fe-S-cluster containining protein
MINKKVRRVGRRVLTVYKDQDSEATKAAEYHKASCQKGCNHCCKRVVLASLPEGIQIAERLIGEFKYQRQQADFVQDLYKQVQFLEKNPADVELDCVFLNNEGACDIYKYRPSICRYLYVVSDPEDCRPNRKVSRIDLSDLEHEVWSEGDRISKQVGVPFRLVAPIPVVVLWGFKILLGGVQGLMDYLPTAPLGLQPEYWIQRLTAISAGGEDQDNVVQEEVSDEDSSK